ncbi:hypothetical protein AK812_SmicGene3407 [Symbiodinium microadriaticum]|uniref:Uncharacterized protein n=1 Tax=Symbiodinium microadriaticum TaxID=2951 RepID=A0A1Q9EYY2_SYMMI|nr:hypothetical protein AK812_SmicGene3407 [Symbiodinium microadriaticum]
MDDADGDGTCIHQVEKSASPLQGRNARDPKLLESKRGPRLQAYSRMRFPSCLKAPTLLGDDETEAMEAAESPGSIGEKRNRFQKMVQPAEEMKGKEWREKVHEDERKAGRTVRSDEEYLPCTYYLFSPEWQEKVRKTLWDLAHRRFTRGTSLDEAFNQFCSLPFEPGFRLLAFLSCHWNLELGTSLFFRSTLGFHCADSLCFIFHYLPLLSILFLRSSLVAFARQEHSERMHLVGGIHPNDGGLLLIDNVLELSIPGLRSKGFAAKVHLEVRQRIIFQEIVQLVTAMENAVEKRKLDELEQKKKALEEGDIHDSSTLIVKASLSDLQLME